jgi:thioredoxin 1
MDIAVDVTDATFQVEVLDSAVLTIVDLWAPWCEPCRRLAPILDQIAAAHPGQIRVAKLNVEPNPGVPGRYGVTGLPTLLVFKSGQVVETIIGFQPKDKILKKLTPHLP